MDDFNYILECYNICKKCDFDREEIGIYVYGKEMDVDKIIKSGQKYMEIANKNQAINFSKSLQSHEQIVSWLSKSHKRFLYYEDFCNSNDRVFREYLMMDCYFTFISNNNKKINDLVERIEINKRLVKKYAKIYYIEYMGLTDSCFKRLEDRMALSDEFIGKLYDLFFDKANSIEIFKVNFPRILYDYFKEYDFLIDAIKEVANKTGISYKKIIRYIVMYARDELKIEDFDIDTENTDKDTMFQYRINTWIGRSDLRKRFYDNYKGEPEEFMNYILMYCYQYSDSVQYDMDKMIEFGKSLDFEYDTIFNYVRVYYTSILHLDWRDKLKEITAIRTKAKNNIKLEKWLNNKDFKNIYDRLGGGEYDVFMPHFVKYCYGYFESIDFNAYKIEIFLKMFEFSLDDIFRLFKNYKEILGINTLKLNNMLERIKIEKKNGNNTLKSKQMSLICNKLESISNMDEIAELMSEHRKVDLNLLYNYIFDYVNGFYCEMPVVEQDEIISSLRKKINDYQKYLSNKELIAKDEKIANSKVIRNRLKRARKAVGNFVMSGADCLEEYCRLNELSENEFLKHLKYIKEYDKNLYKEYQEKCKSVNSDADYEENVLTVKKIVQLIRKGLVVDDTEIRERRDINEAYRPMDLFDYYQITNLSFDKLYRIGMKCLDKIELKSLGSFISKNIYVGVTDKDKILEKNYFLFGIMAKDEEKRAVIKYLEDNNIPVNEEVVKIVLRRYLNGKYMLDGKKLVKKIEE